MISKKTILIIPIVVVIAAGFGFFAQADFSINPEIISASVSPEKVVPGDTMTVTVEVKDSFGIKSVMADMGGIETIELELKEGDFYQGIWEADWLVHDTEVKEYITAVTAVNIFNKTAAEEIKWSDPKYENYTAGTYESWQFYDFYWECQTFTPSVTHTITSVKLELKRYDSASYWPGDLTVEIKATDGDGKPTGSTLASGTYDADTIGTSAFEWVEVSLGEGCTVNSGTKYAIVFDIRDGSYYGKLYWKIAKSSGYAGGQLLESSNSGSSWIAYSYDGNFEEWGAGPPTVTTQAASSVEETTATFNGNITDAGGVNCGGRGFELGTASEIYTSTSSEFGSFSTGAYTYNKTGLSPGTTYYYRAYATNTVGTGYGSEQNFTTKPNPPTSLGETSTGLDSIDVSWTKGSGAENTMVRYQTGSYPPTTSDGSQCYFDTGTSCTASSLSANTTYYFRAWSYDSTSGYSDETSDDTAVTLSYASFGNLTSTNLLSGQSVSTIDGFYYNISALPSGTGVAMQFSNDNSNWYSATGTQDEWSAATTTSGSTISLSSLNWGEPNFYYKLQFTSDGSDTPILDDVQVNYSGLGICTVNQSDGSCGAKAAGENGLSACQRCDGVSTSPVNVDDNTQDIEGENTCSGSCQACQSGSCGNANNDTDPGDDCTQGSSASDGCRGNNCDGSGSCQVISSGDGGCPVCQKCTDSDIVCEEYTDWSDDTTEPNTCSGTPECVDGGCCYWLFETAEQKNSEAVGASSGCKPSRENAYGWGWIFGAGDQAPDDSRIYDNEPPDGSSYTQYRWRCVCD